MLSSINLLFRSKELKGKIVRNGLILSSASFLETLARVIRNMIMARLIAPEYFGLMATIAMAIGFFEAISDVGIRQIVIQSKKGEASNFLNVAWWFSSVRGLLFFTVAFSITPFICDFYDNNALLYPMRFVFVSLLFNGLVSPRLHVLEKNLEYRKWITIKLCSASLNVALALAIGMFVRNIWPLAIGFVVEYICVCLLSYIILPFKPSFKIERSSLNEIWKFAKRMFGLPILSWIFFQIDILAVGKFLSMEQLGLYSLAKSIALVPIMIFSKTVGLLILPTFSKMQDSTEILRKTLLNITDLVTMLCLPFVIFCIIFARPLLTVVYGEKYGTVALSFSILMVYVMIRLLATVMIQLYLALARPDIFRLFAFARVIITGSLIVPATLYFDIPGVAGVVVIGMLSLYIPQLIYASKMIDMRLVSYFRFLIWPFIISCGGALIQIVLLRVLDTNDILVLAAGAFICLLTCVLGFNHMRYKEIFLGKTLDTKDGNSIT